MIEYKHSKLTKYLLLFLVLIFFFGLILYWIYYGLISKNTSSKELIIENPYLSLFFSKTRLTLNEIKDKETERMYNFQESPLWQIVLLDVSNYEKKKYENAFISIVPTEIQWEKTYLIEKQNDKQILHLQWRKKEYKFQVNVEITLPQNSSLSYWKINIKNNNPRYALWSINFPYLKIQALNNDKDNTYLVLPISSGTLIKNPIDGIHWRVSPLEEVSPNKSVDLGGYPGLYSVQFAALYGKSGDGIYLAAYDGNMYNKRFLFDGDNNNSLNYMLRQYPEWMLTPGKSYTSPYEAVVGVFQGDWMDAAEIYRKWAVRQVWCQKGPLYKWKDLSQDLYNMDVAVRAIYRRNFQEPILYQETKDELLAMKEFFDNCSQVNGSPPLYGVHTMGWSKYLDVIQEVEGGRFPDYLPPQEKFKEWVEELKSKGFIIAVYMGDRFFDKRNRDSRSQFEWEEAKLYANCNPLHQVYFWFYDFFAYMCPSTEWWQKILVSMVHKVRQYQIDIDGIYWDHYPDFKLCFNKMHHHNQGGGNYFAKGYREMAEKYRVAGRLTDKNHFIYDEGKSEVEIGVFDGFLNEWFRVNKSNGGLYDFEWYFFTKPGIPIPLITYLYHDYVVMLGGIRIKPINSLQKLEDLIPVTAFLWVNGNKPFIPSIAGIDNIFTKWKNKQLSKDSIEILEYLGKIIKMYKIGKKALTFGRYVRPPKLEGPETASISFNGSRIDISVIFIGAFIDPDGKIYLPVTNWSKNTQKITIIDFSKVKWLPNYYDLYLLTKANKSLIGSYSKENKRIKINLSVKGREAIFLVIEKDLKNQ